MPLTAVQVGAGWFAENPGGLDRYYHDLLEALPTAGVNYRGLVVGSDQVSPDSGGLVRSFARPDDPLLRRWRNARRSAADVWRAIPADTPKVLVTHFALYAYPLLRDRRGRPWVVHFHGPWATAPNGDGTADDAAAGSGLRAWLKRRVERKVYQRADRVVVLSEAYRDVVCGQYGVDPGRVTVVPGGVDVERFDTAFATPKADARRPHGWPAERRVVLCVRRLVPHMGLDTLIDAMAMVREAVPDALCLIAGHGPEAATLNERISARGLTDHVSLLGFVADEDLPLAYRAADISVVPSQAIEGFGLTAAESLAAGTPVLVTPVGGLPEVVRGLDRNLVLTAATESAIADGLIRALKSPDALPTADACHAYAQRTFDWGVVAGKIADVYRSVIGRG